MSEKCPICQSPAKFKLFAERLGPDIDCARCGKYSLSKQLELTMGILTENEIAIISGFLRDNPNFALTLKSFDEIIKNIKMPDIHEKLDRILFCLKNYNSNLGFEFDITEGSDLYYEISGKAYMDSHNEWEYLIIDNLYNDLKYIDFPKYASVGPNFKKYIKITSKAWDYIKKIELNEKGNLNLIQKTYLKGEIFDAYKDVSNIVKSANSSIILIDNYIDENVLTLLSKSNKNVKIIIYTLKISNQLKLDIDKFEQQYGKIEVNLSKDYHDRFLIIDNVKGYHIGASIKDMGKSVFTYSELEPENTRKLIESISDRDPEPSSG